MLKPNIKLTSYQQQALEFAKSQEDKGITNLLLFHSCGSGKSLTSLAWATRFKYPILYLCPARARYTALAEIAKWTTLKPQLLRGENPYYRFEAVKTNRLVWEKYRGPSPKTGKEIWLKRQIIKQSSKLAEIEVEFEDILESCQIYVCTYEILPYWQPFLERLLPGPFSLIFSEIHRLKGWKRSGPKFNKPHGNLAYSAKRLSKLATRILGETGTPIQDRPRDLWAELDLVFPGQFGNFWDFAHKYCGASINQYGGLDTSGSSNTEELRDRLDKFVHRVSAEQVLANIPLVRRNIIRIEAQDQYHEAVAELTGYPKGSLADRVAKASSLKRQAVVEHVENLLDPDSLQGIGKILVFTYLRRDCEYLAKELASKLDCPVLVGHGECSVEDRKKLQDRYMASETPIVLVGTIDSFGESLNLQDTDHFILAGLPYTPGKWTQAEFRVKRVGMKRPVTIHILIASGTVDELIANMLLNKLPAVDDLSDIETSGEASTALEKAIGIDDDQMEKNLLDIILAE